MIKLKDFLVELSQQPLPKFDFLYPQRLKENRMFKVQKDTPIIVDRLMQCLNSKLTGDHVVVADIGDALFASLGLRIEQRSEFLSPAYYTSIGFSVPASIGTAFARPDLRPVVLVGDGAFQMTGMEYSTIARFQLKPIIIILNNKGYGTERPMLDGVFNDLHNWHYSKITEMMGYGIGQKVSTEEETLQALDNAFSDSDHAYIIEAQLESDDLSASLKKLTKLMKEKIYQFKTQY